MVNRKKKCRGCGRTLIGHFFLAYFQSKYYFWHVCVIIGFLSYQHTVDKLQCQTKESFSFRYTAVDEGYLASSVRTYITFTIYFLYGRTVAMFVLLCDCVIVICCCYYILFVAYSHQCYQWIETYRTNILYVFVYRCM